MKEYITSSGAKITIRPISLLAHSMIETGVEFDYRNRGEPIDPPTYEVEVAGGAKTVMQHDATTLDVADNPDQSAANHAAWESYIKARTKMVEEIRKLQTLFLLDAIEFDFEPGWETRQRRFKISIPDDPEEKRVHYITTVLLPTHEEQMKIVEQIMRLSAAGVLSEEALEAASKSFRRNVQTAPASETDTD